ncbi:MAG: hypothetical protein MK082_12305 [Phycisphaerales bacterium]|nr:hypothetical protein [Phycisphaerales bacterium]
MNTMPSPVRITTCLVLLGILWAAVACTSTQSREDPMGTLAQPRSSTKSHLEAMARLDGPVPSPAYLKLLKDIVIGNDYLIPVRKAAYQRLVKADPRSLVSALDLVLGRLEPPEYRDWVIMQIAREDRTELTKAIIRSWAMPVRLWERVDDRPEPRALAMMYGSDQVSTVLIRTMLDASPAIEANLRARCWELVVAGGDEDKLVALVHDDTLVGRDGLLVDMRAAIDDFGIVPRNREEILWIRELRRPERRAYWDGLAKALEGMPKARRRTLEPRDLAVVAAASRHVPELLVADEDAMFEKLESELRSNGDRHTADLTGWAIRISEGIRDDRARLTWGDLAAMTLARQAMQASSLREHLFDFAERDLMDKTTEYGGVIRLDDAGRFELVEHMPRVKVADDRYHAPQSLFDDGYTSLFHIHNHAQRYRNARYAGPHVGDIEYADETGANGLVFTFIDPRTMNVDFYRHGAVIVDLGTISRPDSG